jgi:hypothetical protein
MSETAMLLLTAAIFGVSLLYASVGHGGATRTPVESGWPARFV